MKRQTASTRLRPYAHVNKLNGLSYDDRKQIAADLSLVLQERSAYRVYFWFMLGLTCVMGAAFAYAVVYIVKAAVQ